MRGQGKEKRPSKMRRASSSLGAAAKGTVCPGMLRSGGVTAMVTLWSRKRRRERRKGKLEGGGRRRGATK